MIAVITPLMVERPKGNLKEKVVFVWGTLSGLCLVYSYLLVPETKGLTLEQIDQMLEETNPRMSPKWKPNTNDMYSERRSRASMGGDAEAEAQAEKKYDEDMGKQQIPTTS